MKIICIHCGREFTIRAEDLGGTGYCPHCRGAIALPKASQPAQHEEAPPQRPHPTNWLDSAVSGLLSLVLHMSLFLAIALWQPPTDRGGAGEGEEVLIGLLPKTDLIDRPEEQLTTTEVEKQAASLTDL